MSAWPEVRGTWALCAVVFALLTPTLALSQDKPEPEASQKQDERLSDRLIRKAVAGADEDIMAGIVRMMNEAAERLDVGFDTGGETQALQQNIVSRLEDAIKIAAAQRRPVRRQGGSSSADKRRMPPRAKGESKAGRASTEGEKGAASSSTGEAAQARGEEEQPVRGGLRELRQGWGHLPMREREELIQGIGERYLERYRAWIERYYRALQETEE